MKYLSNKVRRAVWRYLALGALAMLVEWNAQAGVSNDLPSCYAANKIEIAKPPLEREIFVLVDQTTIFDDRLKRSIDENIWNNLRPNSGFTKIRSS